MSHYYQFDENLDSNKRIIPFYVNNLKIDFITDIGVFSNSQVDYGSSLLIKTLLNEPNVTKLLDVGCGYGVIGLTLAYLKKCTELVQIDINKRAVDLTNENIKKLDIKNAIAFVSDGIPLNNEKFDLIAINPPIRAGKKVIYKMYEDSKIALQENGKLWIVIKKSLGAESSITKLKTLFTNVEIIKKDKGYFVIKSFN